MGARRGGEDVEEATIGSDVVGTVGVSLRDAEDMFDGDRSERGQTAQRSLVWQTGTSQIHYKIAKFGYTTTATNDSNI